jgi:hypothetical protein
LEKESKAGEKQNKKEASNFFESELGKSKPGIDPILGNTFNDGVI